MQLVNLLGLALDYICTSASVSVERLRLDRASMAAAISPSFCCRSALCKNKKVKFAILCSEARLAQSVEHGTLNPRVVGSSPTSGALFFLFCFKFLHQIIFFFFSPHFSSVAALLCCASSKISGMAVIISLCISTGATLTTSSSFWQRSCHKEMRPVLCQF